MAIELTLNGRAQIADRLVADRDEGVPWLIEPRGPQYPAMQLSRSNLKQVMAWINEGCPSFAPRARVFSRDRSPYSWCPQLIIDNPTCTRPRSTLQNWAAFGDFIYRDGDCFYPATSTTEMWEYGLRKHSRAAALKEAR